MGLFDWLLGRRKNPPARPTATSRRMPSAPAFAVIDVETTGLSPQRDRILELAIVRLDHAGSIVDEWVSRFDPEGPVGATHIHGIRDEDVVGQPRFAESAETVVAALSGLAVVAHNARFDLAFLRSELTAAGWRPPWIASYCTLDASRAYLPDLERRRLVDCCWSAGIRLDGAHSALGDARAAAELLRAYIARNGGPDPVLLEAAATARATAWPTAPHDRPRTAERPLNERVRSRPARSTPPQPSSPPLLRQLSAMSLLEVVEEGAPVGTIAYLEKLFDALEDGDISDDEANSLQELVVDYDLSASDVRAAHDAFLLALAHRAVDDGRVSHEERRELKGIASLLGVADTTVKRVIDDADTARQARLSAALGPLPDPWPHGEPLRVGDRVVFTGCDDDQRARLEKRAGELGVRVVGAVSRLTVMLVTDGSFSGGKAAKARELGTRNVHPDTFDLLLQHLQPAEERTARRTDAAARSSVIAPKAASPAAIRAWAASVGHDVGVRGRLPKHVIDAYSAAHN
ncbi:exonuclease domain-containing protein [Curtobacterium sp. 260]|uniref:exonuclease domain-containing protein n=1 Tax=Curtobacterium sp. 260 TaxID=2817748 RepID=UPI002786535C|nr:histone-like nucleoid-structuring protein Lsr2 [Curtobacterium sp. 260]MDP9738081.1 DNA polymerase-3 subunit epsilon [Curtobacterium sp. 260]